MVFSFEGCSGMSMAVTVNGKLVKHRGFNYSDLENQIFALSSSIMYMAGVANPVIVTILAKLWQEGLLNLETDLSVYMPDLKPNLDSEVKTVADLVRWVCNNFQEAEIKSNLYQILKRIIESATGERTLIINHLSIMNHEPHK